MKLTEDENKIRQGTETIDSNRHEVENDSVKSQQIAEKKNSKKPNDKQQIPLKYVVYGAVGIIIIIVIIGITAGISSGILHLSPAPQQVEKQQGNTIIDTTQIVSNSEDYPLTNGQVYDIDISSDVPIIIAQYGINMNGKEAAVGMNPPEDQVTSYINDSYQLVSMGGINMEGIRVINKNPNTNATVHVVISTNE